MNGGLSFCALASSIASELNTLRPVVTALLLLSLKSLENALAGEVNPAQRNRGEIEIECDFSHLEIPFIKTNDPATGLVCVSAE